MKNKVAQYVKSLGGSTAYSGKRKTMYIKEPFVLEDVLKQSIEGAVLDAFGYSLPFKLQTNY